MHFNWGVTEIIDIYLKPDYFWFNQRKPKLTMKSPLSCGKIVQFCCLILFILSSFNSSATNPPITNQVINISEGDSAIGVTNYSPELVIDGNTIHAIWFQWQNNLMHKRSIYLEKTDWDSQRGGNNQFSNSVISVRSFKLFPSPCNFSMELWYF